MSPIYQTPPAASSGSGAQVASNLIRYVDPVNGNDSNNGLGPATAYATIPAAYSALTTTTTGTYSEVGSGLGMGAGRLVLAPGTYTMTSRLDLDWRYPVEFVGTRSGRHSHLMSNSATTIKMNSTTATAFFKVAGTNISYGWRFQDLHVLVDQTAVTGNVALACIWNFDGVDDFVVENCSWDTLDNTTNLDIPAIKHDNSLTAPTGDAAWFRIRNNRYSRLALYSGGGAGTSGNYNRWTISQNVGFYGGAIPHVKFNDGAHGGHCENNNLEGTAVGVELAGGSYTQNMWVNNSGEDPSAGTPPNPFYYFSGSVSQQVIVGGSTTVPGGGNGVFAQFGTSAYNNLVIGPYTTTGAAGEKRKIVDGSTTSRNYVITTTQGSIVPVKTGSSPTFADADFTPTPTDGAVGMTHNTSTGEKKLWMRSNGTWGSVSSVGGGGGSVATDSIFDAKGDLAVGTGADTAAKLTVGSNGTVLQAASGQTTGLQWVDLLASPALTGNPTAPTQAPGNNSTRIATTAYADAAVAAGGGGSSPFTVVARTTDSAARNSGNTGSTLTADDTLLFAVSGNSTDVYHVEMLLLFSTGAAGTTSDAKAAWTVPSGTTIKGGYGFVAGSSGFPGSPASATTYAPSAFLTASGPWVWAMGNSTEFFARGELYVYVGGTSGNVVMTWAQNTSDASNLILAKGSHLRITKVV